MIPELALANDGLNLISASPQTRPRAWLPYAPPSVGSSSTFLTLLWSLMVSYQGIDGTRMDWKLTQSLVTCMSQLMGCFVQLTLLTYISFYNGNRHTESYLIATLKAQKEKYCMWEVSKENTFICYQCGFVRPTDTRSQHNYQTNRNKQNGSCCHWYKTSICTRQGVHFIRGYQ